MERRRRETRGPRPEDFVGNRYDDRRTDAPDPRDREDRGGFHVDDRDPVRLMTRDRVDGLAEGRIDRPRASTHGMCTDSARGTFELRGELGVRRDDVLSRKVMVRCPVLTFGAVDDYGAADGQVGPEAAGGAADEQVPHATR